MKFRQRTPILEKWLYYLKDVPSSDIVKIWTFYATVSACLQRRVWISEGEFSVYPNLYIVIIGPAGSGKSVSATVAKDILRAMEKQHKSKVPGKPAGEHPEMCVAPESMTLARLLEKLGRSAQKQSIPPDLLKPLNKAAGAIYVSTPMAFFCVEELETFIRREEHDLVAFLTEGWAGKTFLRETKHNGTDCVINMCLTMLGCATPDWVKRNMSSQILTGGLASRTIFIWCERVPPATLFIRQAPEQMQAIQAVKEHLDSLMKLFGPITFSEEAFDFLDKWWRSEPKPLNPDKHLESYYLRKNLHVMKLALSMHFAKGYGKVITKEDAEDALELLAVTERDMHKALCAAGDNPVYKVANYIKEMLEKHTKPVPSQMIVLACFDMANTAQIQEALDYLQNTKQINSAPGKQGVEYTLI